MAKTEYHVVRLRWISALVLMAALFDGILGGHHNGSNVTYDGRSLIINGEHKLLFSGSIHYPRSTPEVSLISFFLSSFVLLFLFLI